jgi:hypothetical protein
VFVRRIDDGLRRSFRESKRSCAIEGGARQRQRRANSKELASHCYRLPPPPPCIRRRRESAAAESTETAPRSHAGEAAVALHARRSTIVITAEDAVMAGPAALLKPRFPKRCWAKPRLTRFRAAALLGAKPVGHLAIGIRHAEPVFRIMRPRRTAQAPPR